MKNLFFILLIFSTLNANAQNFDLVVTSRGDSIACHIDSITEIDIYFEMKVNGYWLHTYSPLSECLNYEYGTIKEGTAIFKPETSYIKKIIQLNISTPSYDLLVKTNGDSIACYIDSITDSVIYFEMKTKDKWIHTFIDRTETSEYKYDQFAGKILIFKEGSSYIKGVRKTNIYFSRYIYSNRYLFAPSSFAMRKDLLSYSNITLGLHDLQYGFTDRLSIGLGSTMFLFPMYIMPIYSIPINELSSFSVGDLLMFSPFSEDLSFFGNLFYGMYTKGTAENNYSLGLGLWTTTKSDVAGKTISPAINFSSIIKTGYNTYFLTENYLFQYNIDAHAERYDESLDILYERNFLLHKYILGGISGFRVIARRYPRNSWQFALTYLFIISGDIPDQYKGQEWDIWNDHNEVSFIPWPVISYTRKL